jgi:hypothetical protein
LIAQHARERLTLVMGGWLLACILFLVVGVLTPVDMRHYLAAVPALALAAGFGAAWAWTGGSGSHHLPWRVTAAVLLAAAVSTGFHSWWSALG